MHASFLIFTHAYTGPEISGSDSERLSEVLVCIVYVCMYCVQCACVCTVCSVRVYVRMYCL